VRRALTWWRYRTVGDGRVRPNHRKLDGFENTRPADDEQRVRAPDADIVIRTFDCGSPVHR